MEKNSITQKVSFRIAFIIGFLLLLFSTMGLVHNYFNLIHLFNRGVMGINTKFVRNDSALVVSELVPGSGAEKAGISVNDTIILINGFNVFANKDNLKECWGKEEIGNQVIITIKKNNNLQSIAIIKERARTDILIFTSSFLIILPVVFMTYVLVGLWGLLKNPISPVISLIALVCFSFGILNFAPLNFSYSPSFLSEIFFYYDIKNFLSNFIYFAPALWILLFFLFPEKSEFYQSHKKLILFLVYFFPVIITVASILSNYISISEEINDIVALIFRLYLYFGILGGIIVLFRNSKKERNTLQKRQFKLIFFGLKYGGTLIVLGWIIIYINLSFLRPILPFQVMLFIFLLFLVCLIGGLIIPFTFLNTFSGNKILETEWMLKKKLFYIGGSIILFTIYVTISYFICSTFIQIINLSDISIIIIITTLLAAIFFPFNSKLQNKLIQKLYPEKTKYQNAIKALPKKLQSIPEISVLLENVSLWFEKIFMLKPVITLALVNKQNNQNPFLNSAENSILPKIKEGAPFFWDEVRENSDLNESEKSWTLNNHISLTIPLISYGEVVGLLHIGKKINNEDFTGQEIEILKEAVSQPAIALQNLQLQSEYIEKKRLDKELNVARTIQTQLLPQIIPQVKSLDVFGKMRPCFEVAGDYFDILPLDENRTVLALGDVSGKGAGAALLMSNLQAGLRSAFRFTNDISNIVYEINNIINQNTSPEQFITFFIGIWDSSDNSFCYVNAGHNPALIIKPDGAVIKLEATGFFLGPIPNMQYGSLSVNFGKDDILIIYTDGIEETFNAREEQFGVENIIRVIQENRDLSSKEIGNLLYASLENFSPGIPYSDDATVIIAKVTQ